MGDSAAVQAGAAGAAAGFVAPGYEPVLETLAAARGIEPGGAGLAAWADGRLVVDVRRGWARLGIPWGPDTLALLASVTKAFAALCIEILEDRGEIAIDQRVAHYWPEFAQQGKGDITVRQILLHTSGVIGFPTQNELLGWDGKGWNDYDAIAAGLAAAAPVWPPGTEHGYHAVTYGWLVGELVRRIAGETIGTFFAREVAAPLGLDAHLGLDRAEQGRVAAVTDALREDLGVGMRLVTRVLDRRMRGGTLLAYAFLGDGEQSIMNAIEGLLDRPEFLEAEVPASNGVSTAASLARLFALLAAGGELDGVRVVSAASVGRFTERQLRAPDVVLTRSMPPGVRRFIARQAITRALGYTRNELPPVEATRFGPSTTAFGAEGAGGQIAFADPEHGMGVAFVRSRLIMGREAADALIDTLYRCRTAGA